LDQIFDRFERLFKSWVTPEAGEASRSHGSYGDPDLDSAMSELDDFLDRDRTATEAKERERERREREARARAQAGGAGASPSGPPPRLVEAYKTMGLAFGAPFPQVKAAYKKLLMQHHPDRNNDSPERQKRATELSAKINAAYQLIETWSTTGKLPAEG